MDTLNKDILLTICDTLNYEDIISIIAVNNYLFSMKEHIFYKTMKLYFPNWKKEHFIKQLSWQQSFVTLYKMKEQCKSMEHYNSVLTRQHSKTLIIPIIIKYIGSGYANRNLLKQYDNYELSGNQITKLSKYFKLSCPIKISHGDICIGSKNHNHPKAVYFWDEIKGLTAKSNDSTVIPPNFPWPTFNHKYYRDIVVQDLISPIRYIMTEEVIIQLKENIIKNKTSCIINNKTYWFKTGYTTNMTDVINLIVPNSLFNSDIYMYCLSDRYIYLFTDIN